MTACCLSTLRDWRERRPSGGIPGRGPRGSSPTGGPASTRPAQITPDQAWGLQHKGLSHVSGGSAAPRKPMRAGPSWPAQHQGASVPPAPPAALGPPSVTSGHQQASAHCPPATAPGGAWGGCTPSSAPGQAVHSQGRGRTRAQREDQRGAGGLRGAPTPPSQSHSAHLSEWGARTRMHAHVRRRTPGSHTLSAHSAARAGPAWPPAPQDPAQLPRAVKLQSPTRATEAGARSQGRVLLGQEAPAQAALPSQGAGGLGAERHRPPRGHTSVRRIHPSGSGAAVSLRGPASGVAGRTGAKGRCHSALQECPQEALRPGHTGGAHVPPGTGPPGPGEGGPAPEPPRHHPLGFSGLTGEGPVPFPASAVPPATATESYFLSEALPTQPLQHHPETTSFQGRLQHPPPGWELPGPGLLPHPETSAGKGEADMGSGPALPAPKVTQPGQGTEAGPGRENPAGGLAGATALGLS